MSTIDIPATYRKRVYYVFAAVGIVIGGTSVAYSTAELGQPVWLKVVAAVFAFVSGAVGYVAGNNTETVIPAPSYVEVQRTGSIDSQVRQDLGLTDKDEE